MSQHQPNPRRGRRATTQTIEQIDAEAAAIRQAEEDVMVALAGYLRDLAVQLPVESKLPVVFAKTAKAIGLYTGRESEFPWLGFRDVSQMVEEYGRERCEDLYGSLARQLGKEAT
jgi:hypothetical protein